METNYFFFDGSALSAQIRQLQRARPEFRSHRLCPQKLLRYYIAHLRDLHDGYYKRATFYFPNGDESNVERYIVPPNHAQPGEVRDIHFKYCGRKLKKSAEYDKFFEENVPPQFQDRYTKSEKGIDIEICCDALRLASASRVERLFLLTNDGDFVPLCRTLKEFGANISIIHLSSETPPNAELLREADSYDVVKDDQLLQLFDPVADDAANIPPPGGELVADVAEGPISEKPKSEPSDLASVVEGPDEEEETDDGP